MSGSYPGKTVRRVSGSERSSELKAKSDHLRRRSLIPKDIAVGGRFSNNREGWRPFGQRYSVVSGEFITVLKKGRVSFGK
jgi:hypothetical protein